MCFLWGTNWTVSTATSSQYLAVNSEPIVCTIGILNISQPCRPPGPVKGTALLLDTLRFIIHSSVVLVFDATCCVVVTAPWNIHSSTYPLLGELILFQLCCLHRRSCRYKVVKLVCYCSELFHFDSLSARHETDAAHLCRTARCHPRRM
jgi:hypothetical protein